jgi:hypothetical protein
MEKYQDEHPGLYFQELSKNVLDYKYFTITFFDVDPDPGSF